jgi:Flp pilus assembly protein TadD
MERTTGRDAVVSEYSSSEKPAEPEALYLLGFAQRFKVNCPKHNATEKARHLRPNNAGLQRDLGRLYGQIGDFTAARKLSSGHGPSNPDLFIWERCWRVR